MTALTFITPLFASFLASACSAEPAVTKPHATPSILTEYQSAKPGSDIRVIVSFSIDQPWHLYWDGLNDTGQPPQFTWTLPKGWTMSPPQFPIPHRNVQPGDIVDYIYESSLQLGFILTIPKNAKPGTESLSAAIEWLECSDRCMFGAGEVKTSIGVLGNDATSKPKANSDAQKAIRELDNHTPRPWSEAKDVVMELKENSAIFAAKTAIRLEFFPGRAGSTPKNQLTGTSVDGSVLNVEFLTEKSPPKVDGILAVYRTKGAPADYYRLSENPSPPKATDPAAAPVK